MFLLLVGEWWSRRRWEFSLLLLVCTLSYYCSACIRMGIHMYTLPIVQ